MASLSLKQQAFIKLMKNGEDYERRGFELLLQHSDFPAFFDALQDEGLFDPSRNFGPVEADKPGYYRVPYWPPLNYFEAVARFAGEKADAALAEKVMGVIRGVSQWRDGDGKPRDNHSTWQSFAKILGLLPSSAVSLADIDLAPIWFTGRFDRSMASHALMVSLRKFLASGDHGDWVKACRILYHCTAVIKVDDSEIERATSDVQTVLDDHWLKQLIASTATEFGRKVGKEAAGIFRDRVSEVFARTMDGRATSLLRPAIEDHQQNHDRRGAYNHFVEGLRDTVLAWADTNIEEARPFVAALLDSGTEILERIAIYVLDQRFELLPNLTSKAIAPAMFDAAHRHELYHFLHNHFQQLTEDEKASVLEVIRNLPLRGSGDDAERRRRNIQRDWLKSIAGKSYEPIERWLLELNDEPADFQKLVPPDFSSYHEMRWGFGPTPYEAQELVAYAQAGTLVDHLNEFEPSSDWDGPSTRSLSDAVIEAVGAAPDAFLDELPRFLAAKPEYQYAIIAGFKKLWDAWDGRRPDLSWDRIWPDLIGFFEAILNSEDFWKGEVSEESDLSPTRNWIPPVVAEFLESGTANDDKAYTPALLPRTLRIIVTLLDKAEPLAEPLKADALTVAMNTNKGKAVEALINHALRACRLSDKAGNSHTDAWREYEPLFDRELSLCRNGNFEFSALAGAYIVNFHYMNGDWVHTNLKLLFPIEFSANCFAALDGIAFAPSLKPIVDDLIAVGVVDWALRQKGMGPHARESLLQRLGLSYLSGDEQLTSARFAYLFQDRRFDDLTEIGRYFWMVRGEALTDEQKERIFLFWDGCVAWATTLDSPPAGLLSQLSLLSCYLGAVDQRALKLLVAVAPFTPVNYHADSLIEELARLAETRPGEVAQVLDVLLQTYRPTFDFEDRLKNLIVYLAAHPQSRSNAILSVERVRHLPGMVQLYSSLTSSVRF